MNCRDAQFYLRLRRESADELGDVAADLDRHIAACRDCAADARADRSFDAALGAAMRAVVVPATLRNQLVANLSATRGSLLRRKAYRTVALAASLFLTVGLAFGAFGASRPKLDTMSLVMATDEQLQSPEESTHQWLAGQKLPPQLPLRFDYDLFVMHGTQPVQGRDVPVVIFRERGAGPGIAKVFLFRRGTQFDLKGIQDSQASHSRALVIDNPKQFPGVVYVVVHTGQTLDPFLKSRGNEFTALR